MRITASIWRNNLHMKKALLTIRFLFLSQALRRHKSQKAERYWGARFLMAKGIMKAQAIHRTRLNSTIFL
jgi:hypothetical protein